MIQRFQTVTRYRALEGPEEGTPSSFTALEFLEECDITFMAN
jgi:hypothetical protein